MRYMLMHKTNASNEAGIRPSPELIAAVRAMIAEMNAAKVFRDGAGLRASSLGVRVKRAAGTVQVSEGPFPGDNELTAALAVLRVRSRDEAVEWALRLAEIVGEVEVDIRPVTEPWDLGLTEKPGDDPTTRYMLLLKANAETESGAVSESVRAAVAGLIEAMKQAGVWTMGEALRSSREAKRIRPGAGKPAVMDGPFAESKELIAGYITLELPSIDAALPWARGYSALLDGAEVDVRPLYEAGDLR
jgi:hypothetical protein